MVRCQECGFKNADSKKNCEKCGSKLYDLSSVNFNPDVVRTNLPEESLKTIKVIEDEMTHSKAVIDDFPIHHTQPLSSLDFFGEAVSPKKFNLINEKTGEKLTFESQKSLHRENLAPENLTVSHENHATIFFENNQWRIKDESTNGATFVQVKNQMPIESGTRIIIGNQIFRFEE